MKLRLEGHAEALRAGLELLREDWDVSLEEEGMPLTVRLDSGLEETLRIVRDRDRAEIRCRDKAAFFRSLGLLKAREAEENYVYAETRRFDRNGVMFDCSRNAVNRVEQLKFLFRRMALMGLSWAMMYTEETYELDGEPYFGYCRGRYTEAELRELDDYADALGIELIPCIQTLSHLERFLHWPQGGRYADTVNTLRVGDDQVYDLIRRMLVSASRPYRSKRIHIGMDEAWDLGRGVRLSREGYTPPAVLMAEHLKRVRQIVNELGLHAMMWSDMHFENAGPGGYYGEEKTFTEEIVRSAPPEIDLVYWDYYHETERGYDRMLRDHERFQARTVFAGGIWTWSGIAADYQKTLTILEPALNQCVKHGVREVFATAWGDNGAECPSSALLLGMQAFAEYDYTGNTEKIYLDRRLRECTSEEGEAFRRIADFQHPFVCRKAERGVTAFCKPLLYEDPLLPLFEKDLEGRTLAAHYESLWHDFEGYAVRAGERIQPMLLLYAALGRALYWKCRWREQAAETVRRKERQAAGRLTAIARENEAALERLADAWRTVWLLENKPQGFEIIDMRVGGVRARFRSAALRMEDFAAGRIDDIPELTEEKLPFLKQDEETYSSTSLWDQMISACKTFGA